MPIGYQWLPPSGQLLLGWAMPPALNLQMIMPTSTAPFLLPLGNVQSQYHQMLSTSNQYQQMPLQMPLPPLHMPLPPHIPHGTQFKTHNNQLGLISIDNCSL